MLKNSAGIVHQNLQLDDPAYELYLLMLPSLLCSSARVLLAQLLSASDLAFTSPDFKFWLDHNIYLPPETVSDYHCPVL